MTFRKPIFRIPGFPSRISPAQLARSLELKLTESLSEFPWTIVISDWQGNRYRLGKGRPHWYGRALEIYIGTEEAAKDALALNGLRFLERFISGEVNFQGNLYVLTALRRYIDLDLSLPQYFGALVRNSWFQTPSRARVNIKSHYDIPHEILEIYLDKVYRSYSCAFFEQPGRREVHELLEAGNGRNDNFDSLEKAQWRKFQDTVDFIQPASGDRLLDVGCGYGGQLAVALENGVFGKVVGWTWSANDVRIGRQTLSQFDPSDWEINHGDYRGEDRVYDHVASTGMVSHVGPRGLIPYVKNIRARIKSGGHYVHHALMNVASSKPLDAEVGAAFNKQYIWPGFHWFTLDKHVRALEENGFVVEGLEDFTEHYGKTLVAWYERLMSRSDYVSERMGEETFRAWQVYLAGGAGATDARTARVCRVYCTAV